MATYAEISEILDKEGRCVETKGLPTIIVDATPITTEDWSTFSLTFEVRWRGCTVDTSDDAERIEMGLKTIVVTALLGKVRVTGDDIKRLKSRLRECLEMYVDRGVLTPSGGGDEDQ